jgi:class 3 adenylate cyclase/tetratricopeptide (TPR) repeat protein
MTCQSCGHQNPTDNRFCGGCGAGLESTCPSCDRANPSDHRFCGGCGAVLAVAAAVGDKPDLAPGAYTPKHLAEKILRSRAAVEGERKQVTVLFADVKGSMDLAEQMSAERWHAILDRFFTILAEGVHRFEGTVNQYTGDGIMALFGAPLAHEDHAHRACWAALYLRDELRRYADALRVDQGLSFSTRIGINSGEVVVGKIGDDLRMDYTAQGHTVGLAQRMEQLAEPGQAYLTGHTAALVAGYFELRDLGPTNVKGSIEPLGVHVLEGMGAARTRLDVSRARGFTKFVGRADEMAALEAALERSLAGHGQTVGVVADAGTGKSRLCAEFAERCRARGIVVLEARAVAHGKHVPLLPILELLRGYFGVADNDGALTVREKIAGRLLLLDDSLREDLPLFFDLLGVTDPDRPMPALDPENVQRRLFAAIRAIVKADGQRELPAIVLFEDLHWIDAISEAFLAQVVEATGSARGLNIVNFRPGYHAEWMNNPSYQQLPLVPLGRAAIDELLDDLRGRHATRADLPAMVGKRAGGNPFFIEEIIQSLVETSALEGARGAYRLVQPIAELAVPATVQAVLAARIDRLPEHAKTLLQQASVIGKTFEERVLRRISELPPEDFDAGLRTLRDGEFLFEAALYPHVEYAFKHPLTQEVADQSQLSDTKAATHAAVARVIEELSSERLDEESALLAHHWEQAGESAAAARWHARAADWVGFNDYAESYKHWHRVVELTRGGDIEADIAELRTAAFRRLITLAFRCPSPPEEEQKLFEEARRHLERQGGRDNASLAILTAGYSALHQNTGAIDSYLACASEAVRIADQSGSPEVRATVRVDHMYALFLKGRLEESHAVADEIIAIVGDDVLMGADLMGYSPYVMYYGISPWALIECGRTAEAERRARHAIATASEHGPEESLCWAHGSLVFLLHAKGEADGAESSARLSLEAAERAGSSQARAGALLWSGLAHLLVGNFDAAVTAARAADELCERDRAFTDIRPWMKLALAEGLLGMGEPAAALDAAKSARVVSLGQGQPVQEARGAILEARCLLAEHGAAARNEITTHLAHAAEIVERLGAVRWSPHILEVRAQLARSGGDEGAALDAFAQALRLFEEHGATGHAARIMRELGA